MPKRKKPVVRLDVDMAQRNPVTGYGVTDEYPERGGSVGKVVNKTEDRIGRKIQETADRLFGALSLISPEEREPMILTFVAHALYTMGEEIRECWLTELEEACGERALKVSSSSGRISGEAPRRTHAQANPDKIDLGEAAWVLPFSTEADEPSEQDV